MEESVKLKFPQHQGPGNDAMKEGVLQIKINCNVHMMAKTVEKIPLTRGLSSNLSRLTRALIYSERADELECSEGCLSKICTTLSGSLL